MAKIKISFDVDSDKDGDVIQIAQLLKANRALSPMLCELLRVGYGVRYQNDMMPLIESDLLRDNRVMEKPYTTEQTKVIDGQEITKRRLHVRTKKSNEVSCIEDIEMGLQFIEAIEDRDTDTILEMFPQLAGMLISQLTINVQGNGGSPQLDSFIGQVEDIDISPDEITNNFLNTL